MRISDDFRRRLAETFLDAARRMEGERSALGKLYWFSAGYNMAQRIMNLEYDADLLLLFQICQTAHQNLQGRLAALSAGPELGAGLPTNVFTLLEKLTAELGEAIRSNADLTPLLRRVAELGYSATGNGFYLWSIGHLKLE